MFSRLFGKKKNEEQNLTPSFEQQRLLKSMIRDNVEPLIKLWIDTFNQTVVNILSPGDEVIPNIYDLEVSSGNGWDVGIAGLMSCLEKSQKEQPFTATIKEVVADTSLVEERFDHWSDNLDYDLLFALAHDKVKAQERFKIYCDRDSFNIPGYMGIYYSASFTTSVGFNPKWRLNVYSFLPVESEAGKATKDLWEQEARVKETMRLAREIQASLEERISLTQQKFNKRA